MNKILIVGSGSIAQRHAKNLIKLGEKNIFLYSNSKNQKKKISMLFPKIHILYKLEPELFSHIILANSSYERFKVLKNLQNLQNFKNKKIYFEKPLACSLQQLKKIKKISNFFIAGFQLRAHPLIIKIKKILNKNKKKLKYCSFEIGHDLRMWRNNYDISKIYYSKNPKYSGVLWELCHEIDMAYYLFGLPKKIFSRNLKLMKYKKIDNDFSKVYFEYKGMTLDITMDMISPFFKRKYEFIFEDKIIIVDLVKNEIQINIKNKKKKLFKIKKFQKNQMFLSLMSAFLNKSKHSFASFNDIYNNNLILNRLKMSSSKQKLLLM